MSMINAESHADLKSMVSEGLALVDYGAPWCPPCRTLLPILDELDRELNGQVPIVKVNCDDLPDAASEAGVMSLPTVIVYKNGEPMEKLVGLRPKNVYRQALDKHR